MLRLNCAGMKADKPRLFAEIIFSCAAGDLALKRGVDVFALPGRDGGNNEEVKFVGKRKSGKIPS